MEGKVDVVTLASGERYILLDSTIQDYTKYYIAHKLDENNNPIVEEGSGKIFEEYVEDNETYLNEVEETDKYNYLAAVFASKLNDLDIENN